MIEFRVWLGSREIKGKKLFFGSTYLRGGLDLDLIAEPESEDGQVIQHIYRERLLLTLPAPAPSLGNMYPLKL